MLLDDKVVIVSGIGPGLGSKLAVGAAREGARLSIAARSADKLNDVCQLIHRDQPNADILAKPTDITSRDACRELIEATVAKFGRIDALINCAFRLGELTAVDTSDLNDWRSTMETNLFGTMNLIQETIPQMKSQATGSIVIINTQVTRVPEIGQAGYGASKSALIGAAAHLANEMGQYGIRVNTALMSYMWGEPVKSYLEALARSTGTTADALRKDIESGLPLRRIPTDEECANVALFLASDYSSAMTGACVDANGGNYLPH